tara:strand:- start:109 stop:411 length:303 start_codon:yes stop_codon:yes gene_type:complete
MKKVLVETIYTFKHSYLCEMSDESPKEWAMDIVAMEEADEFTQESMGEMILGCRVVSTEEAIEYYNEINSDFPVTKIDRFVTPWRYERPNPVEPTDPVEM